jgi:tripartite-type tricarboxylate transporter receptor subunit TctC
MTSSEHTPENKALRFRSYSCKDLLGVLACSFASVLLCFCTIVAAQSYPAKAVRFVIPYPPGGASDVTARILGAKLTDAWGQQVVIDNRPGANGIIALENVAKSAPDGYTILMANVGPNAINPVVYSKLPYDAIRDFAPVTLTTKVPQVIVANAYLPAKSIKELIALAKAKPDQIVFASGGSGSSNHLAFELFKSMAGVKMVHVAYKGDAPALTDAISGYVQLTMPTVIAATAHIRSGKLRALGVGTLTRVPALPDVPTVAEAGVPGYESESWGGVMARAGTPQPVIDRLHGDITRILKQADVREKLEALGGEIVGSTPSEFAAYLKAEIAKWDKVARTANIRLD